MTVWFRLECGTDTLQCSACGVFPQPHKFCDVPRLSDSQECHWTLSQPEEPAERLTQALVYTPEMLKIKARTEQKATKEEGGAPHVLTPYSSPSNWFPIQSGSPPTLEKCSEMEAELGLAEVKVCVPSQVTQLGRFRHTSHADGGLHQHQGMLFIKNQSTLLIDSNHFTSLWLARLFSGLSSPANFWLFEISSPNLLPLRAPPHSQEHPSCLIRAVHLYRQLQSHPLCNSDAMPRLISLN